MNSVTARSIALAGAIAVGALSEALVCQPARADYYAFANTQDVGYAVLSLTVDNRSVAINAGRLGWISSNSALNARGILGAPDYLVGFYNGASYNDYFVFNLPRLSSTAKVTSATLTVYSGLISERLNYTLFGATQLISPLETLLETGASPANLYDNLMSGPEYDPSPLFPTTHNTMGSLTFNLNGSAIADINAAIGSPTRLFALAGHAEPAVAVPEPSTWVLALAGFVGLGVVARRRAARRRAAVSAG
jgi:hypothetical protein